MQTLIRADEVDGVRRLLRRSPVVALLGPRQVGKTTLARRLATTHRGPTTTFDLEDPRDVARLADPMLALTACRGLVVLDEIQRRPDLFSALQKHGRSAQVLTITASDQPTRRSFARSRSGRQHPFAPPT